LAPSNTTLAAAILAVRLPGAAPYQGVVDLQRLDDALVPLQFDASTLAWLAGLARPIQLSPHNALGPPDDGRVTQSLTAMQAKR
jgi:hypothetical protein